MTEDDNRQEGYEIGTDASAEAASRVQGPAVGLIVTAALGMAGQAVVILVNLLGAGVGAAAGGEQAFAGLMQGGVAIASGFLGILFGVVVLLGALKMRKLESHGFAIAASIIAMIPCISPCCFLGIPMGIWALVVLLNEDVKAGFQA